jgi:hypothetical protein
MALRDENVEAVRAARDSLLLKYGGLHGWFRHLQSLDRRRQAKAARRRKASPKG